MDADKKESIGFYNDPVDYFVWVTASGGQTTESLTTKLVVRFVAMNAEFKEWQNIKASDEALLNLLAKHYGYELCRPRKSLV